MSNVLLYPGNKLFLFLAVLSIFSIGSSAGTEKNEILLVVHDREISGEEFLYHYHNNYQEINNKNINEFLDSFVDFHLKLAFAREKQVHHQIGFINELTEYRLLLAEPYLTDSLKVKELATEATERFKNEVRTNHIFIKFPADTYPDDTLEAYKLAVQIRNQIEEAGSFKKVAESLPKNQMISVNLKSGYITALQSDYSFESVAFKLRPGEISKPVKAPSGYYIIHLTDKKENNTNPKSEDEVLTLIKEIEDERKELIKEAFVERLKKEWNFWENRELLEVFIDQADERIYNGNWTFFGGQAFNDDLILIDDKGISLEAFIRYMQDLDIHNNRIPVRDFILHNYEQFVSKRLIQYENYKLPEKYPVFRYQYEEYRDAMLLLQVTKQEVWQKAASDSTGIKKYFEENKITYTADSDDISFNDVFEAVQADYQKVLMNQWVQELHNIYNVELNEKVLSSLLQKSAMN